MKLPLNPENFILTKYSGHCDICDQFSQRLYMYLRKKQYYCTVCYEMEINHYKEKIKQENQGLLHLYPKKKDKK